jgi:hypothetical protein
MHLSKPQISRFFREWQAICRAQDLTGSEAEAARHELLARAGFTSLTEVDKTAGYDRVLAELAIAAGRLDLAPQLNVHAQPRIRLLHKINALEFDPPYIAAICRDRFGAGNLDALPDPDLRALLVTLTARRKLHVECPF